jgi:hypothetical protein
MIITLDGRDIGWFQSCVKDEALFPARLFVDRASRGQALALR